MVNKKIIAVVLVSCLFSYLIVSYFLNDSQEEGDLDGKFESVLDEVNSYGGAMVVSYDKETGEIIGKRRKGEKIEAGVLSLTEEEYKITGSNIPEGTLVVLNEVSPSRAVIYGVSN